MEPAYRKEVGGSASEQTETTSTSTACLFKAFPHRKSNTALQPMLPSPDRSPEPSAIVGTPELNGDRPGCRSPDPAPEDGGVEQSNDRSEQESEYHEEFESEANRNVDITLRQHPTDEVSFDLAKMMVNMHEHYSTELASEKQRNVELQAHQEEMRRKLDEMEIRLQTHVILMEGFVSFMTQVRDGKFDSSVAPEVGIARSLGRERFGMVQSLIEAPTGYPQEPAEEALGEIAESSPMQLDEEVQVQSPGIVEMNRQVAEVLDQMDIPSPHEVREAWDDFIQLPLTPDFNTAPIRSTGIRATKRRNPFSCTSRRPKRKPAPVRCRRQSWIDDDDESSGDEYQPSRSRLRYRSLDVQTTNAEIVPDEYVPASEPEHTLDTLRSQRRTRWRAVNVVESPVDEEPETRDDSDYQPEPAVQDDHHSISSSSRSPSPVPSSLFEDFHTPSPPPPSTLPKPRYSTPRQTGYRYASGPPSRPFRYHRMPKTVALVWQEWKRGLHGNPPIEALEQKYGTGWRSGTLKERKYASNYVGVRQKIVRKVEEICEEGRSEEEVLRLLNERVAGRMQLLLVAIRQGDDPLTTIPKKVVS